MKHISRTMIVVSILVMAALQLSACSDTSPEAAADDAPATIEPIKGTDLSSVKLSQQAAKRLGIETAAVSSRGPNGVIPYDSVLYDAGGATFTYTSPERLVFVRAPITVARIDGDKAILSAGPKAGTEVVTVGLQELYGTEYEVEED
jgi:multidrug efflux pump subunit AcrA (membrane-fusion protein)